MTVRFLTPWNGYQPGDTATLSNEAALIAGGIAETSANTPARSDQPVALGPLNSGEWQRIPSIWRLRLTGTGTCTLDARDSLGKLTLAFATYTASAATDQIEFPFAGTNAVDIRATLTGTCTAEVI